MEIIDVDQTTFLLIRYIINNVLLTHETINWAKRSKHDFIFLKFDFVKAYDKVFFFWNYGQDAFCKRVFHHGQVAISRCKNNNSLKWIHFSIIWHKTWGKVRLPLGTISFLNGWNLVLNAMVKKSTLLATFVVRWMHNIVAQ